MAFKKIPLTIDTMIRNPVPIEGINQEDNIELNIVVTENKTPKDLSSQTIKVYVRRIDGTLVEQTDQITPTNARKGEVTVKLKNSAFNKEGYALFQLDISDSSGRITSSYATFKVGKGLVSGEAIANTNEIEALKKVEECIKKANQELEKFKQTVVTINGNEVTREENEATRQENEATRIRNEEERKEVLKSYQTKNDEGLKTNKKIIVEAINEINDNVLKNESEIDRLTSGITPNMTTFLKESVNLFNKDDVEIEKGSFINIAGNFSKASGYNVSGYIEGKANDVFTHKFNSSLSGKDATFVYYNVRKEKMGFATGELSENEETCKITMPDNENIAYFRVTFTDVQKLEFMIVKGERYPDKYIKYGELKLVDSVVFNEEQKKEVKKLSLGAIEETPIKANQTDFFEVSKNLFNKEDIEIQSGKFINNNGGVSSAGGYNISGYIKVDEGEKYTYKFNSGQFGSNTTYLYYGERDELLGNAKGSLNGEGETCTLTAPIGAKKVKINFIETDKDSLMFVKGSVYPNYYEGFSDVKFTENIGLNNKQKEQVKTLISTNPLIGKIITLNGDSICYGAGFKGGYGKIIADRNNMVYENIAVSGATIATNTTDRNTGKNRHWISSTISNMREDADYVVLEGGVNDASSHVAIGEITTGYSSPLDNTTFCGAFESMLKQTFERFPGKKVGFIIVHKMCNEFNSSEGENYYHKAIQILEKWGVPYLDLNTKCPPLNYIPNLKKTYTHNGDGWHPNEEGYKKYYCDEIEAFLKRL